MPTPEEALAELARTWPQPSWTWDARFKAIASTFGAPLEAQARAALSAALPGTWTGETLPQAPTVLSRICAATGGLRAGQLLFAGAAFAGVTPYGLWWPWSGGQTITLRLGFAGADDKVLARMRALFKVPG